jgi:aconitate hydratase
MGDTLTCKILRAHLVEGDLRPGETIALRVDQTLTQDATGTVAYLQFEAMGVDRVRTDLSVSYVDHNMLQTGPENADDHRYLQTVAARYGIVFSKPGNGICHQVHLERFGVPGKTLLGSDSHTPTCGGLGMIAVGAGGQDVACAMAGLPFYVAAPALVKVELRGRLQPWVTAKDVILELLRRLSVKGGVGKVFEYAGPGVGALSVPERATITNMGAELGATTSIFPSDEQTRRFLAAQEREGDWQPLAADRDAAYDASIELDLSALEPMVALSHSPDNVKPVAEAAGLLVDQVAIGSCTNSSYADLMTVAAMLRGRKVHPKVSLVIAPGSRQVLEMIARDGALADLIAAGARILESACGPCIGMGQAPPTGGVSLRTFNRNFPGRSGTMDAQVLLCGPHVAAAAAIAGELVDPRALGEPPRVEMPARYLVDDSMLAPPAGDPSRVEIIRGPNIKPVPRPDESGLPDQIAGPVLLAVGDNITTDDIMPAGAALLPLRSNLPALAMHTFERLDPGFAGRAKQAPAGFIVAGLNYGQGSSREHAAMAPAYLGIKAVFAKSFARIHRANLINVGILPLVISEEQAAKLQQGVGVILGSVRRRIEAGEAIQVKVAPSGETFAVEARFTERERRILLAGGLLNYVREGSA